MKGNLIIISSPSGGGKGTLIREVLKTVPSIGYSVSFTTRPIRDGELEGRDYFFVSPEEFERRKVRGEFLEWARVHDNDYATAKEGVREMTDQGNDVILEIDVQGAKNVLGQMPEAVSIFILPPSYSVLEARLTSRATENSGDLDVRLRNAPAEVQDYRSFAYVVVNEEVGTATQELCSIIMSERLRPDRQEERIKTILDSFDISNLSMSGE
ncbi:MAG: guanylate kinase [Pyrinomonadaceae bacterium]